MNRLFPSRTENQSKPDKIEIEDEQEKKQESKFFEEYIPLDPEPMKFEDKHVEKGSYEPKCNNLINYKGPYPNECLLKARKSLIESFKPVTRSTVYTDRTFEILKLKLKIPSKFEGDRKLMNRIRAKQRDHLYDVNQKIRLAEKLSGKNLEKSEKNKVNKHTFIRDDDDDSDNKSFVSDYSFDKNDVIVEDKFEFNENSNVFFSLYQESAAESVVEVKKKEEESESEEDDVDSKCKQFDKYSTKIKTKNIKNSIQSEIVEMEQKYRDIRDERNKLNKNRKRGKNKKTDETVSKVEMNIKKEELDVEMKKIRNCLKKLRKCSRKESKRTYKQRKRKANF